VFLSETETCGRAEAKSHQINGALEWRAGCNCLGSLSDGSSEPVAATNTFRECLLTLQTA